MNSSSWQKKGEKKTLLSLDVVDESELSALALPRNHDHQANTKALAPD
jgi:hypothetical protein